MFGESHPTYNQAAWTQHLGDQIDQSLFFAKQVFSSW